MSFRNLLCFGAVILLASAVTTVQADVPQLINYQGALHDGNGDPVTTPVNAVFAIWDAEIDGDSVWSESRTVEPDAEGAFSIQLGEVTPIGDEIFAGPDRWLSIKVESDPEMTPRARLVSVGYSLRVGTVDGSVGGVISGDVSIQSDLTVSGKVTIGPGHTNTGDYAFVAGRDNTASYFYATVSGGRENTASNWYATVGGGFRDTASGHSATVGGGAANTASGDYGTVCGGGVNTASNWYATVGGGLSNVASGVYATVAGGFADTASGRFSFAAGRSAKADHDGLFVWADSNKFVFPTATESNFTPDTNMFLVRSTGGVVFVSGIDGSGNSNSGVQLAAGGGSWSSLSDRNLKENFAQVDGVDILARIAALPISTWNYKAQDESIRHIGPMAQDVYATFGVGEDDRHITTIDADGIALAAIQGLYQENIDLKRRLGQLEALVEQMLEDKE